MFEPCTKSYGIGILKIYPPPFIHYIFIFTPLMRLIITRLLCYIHVEHLQRIPIPIGYGHQTLNMYFTIQLLLPFEPIIQIKRVIVIRCKNSISVMSTLYDVVWTVWYQNSALFIVPATSPQAALLNL